MTDADFGDSKLPRVSEQRTDYTPIQDFGFIEEENGIGQEPQMFGDQSRKFEDQSRKFGDQSHKFGDQSQQFDEDGDEFSSQLLTKHGKKTPAKDDAKFNSYLRRLINEWRLTK